MAAKEKLALISVSDKQGLNRFAPDLVNLGFRIVSTGGTAKHLRSLGLQVTDVSDLTKFPEMMGGRLKTLHPKVHGGLLARPDEPGDMDAVAKHGISLIDLLVVNLYPFAETAARPNVTLEEVIEQIDIGGPAMLRSAAKNHASVMVVVNPMDYGMITGRLQRNEVDRRFRHWLAYRAFQHTAAYDVAIAEWFGHQIA